jgi:hypothetical protein
MTWHSGRYERFGCHDDIADRVPPVDPRFIAPLRACDEPPARHAAQRVDCVRAILVAPA